MLLSVAGDKKDKIQKSCNSYLENWSLKIPSISKITYTDASTFCWGSQVRVCQQGALVSRGKTVAYKCT